MIKLMLEIAAKLLVVSRVINESKNKETNASIANDRLKAIIREDRIEKTIYNHKLLRRDKERKQKNKVERYLQVYLLTIIDLIIVYVKQVISYIYLKGKGVYKYDNQQ